jgi:hypothetical protein
MEIFIEFFEKKKFDEYGRTLIAGLIGLFMGYSVLAYLEQSSALINVALINYFGDTWNKSKLRRRLVLTGG